VVQHRCRQAEKWPAEISNPNLLVFFAPRFGSLKMLPEYGFDKDRGEKAKLEILRVY
jgi:hypothetical protein